MNIHFLLLAGFVALIVCGAILAAMVKNGFFKCLLFSVLSGLGALFLLHFTSLMSGIALSVNWYSMAISSLGGIPGVIGMVVMQILV